MSMFFSLSFATTRSHFETQVTYCPRGMPLHQKRPAVPAAATRTCTRRRLLPDTVAVASLCAGMCSEKHTLSNIRDRVFQHVLVAEKDVMANTFLDANVTCSCRVKDVMDLKVMESAPGADLVICGFPCQPFSIQGLGQGVLDKSGRGIVVYAILLYIERVLPSIFIMENVANFARRHKQTMDDVLALLRNVKEHDDGTTNAYFVTWQILNMKTHGGLPQSRERVFIIGIRYKGRKTVHFEWPQPVPMVPLDDVLGATMMLQCKRLHTYDHYPFPKAATARKRLQEAIDEIRQVAIITGKPPTSYTAVVDTQSCKRNNSLLKGVAPCLTRSRGESFGFWSLQHGQPLTIRAMLALMGIDEADVCVNVPPRSLGALAGNAFPVTLLTRVLRAAIKSYEED